MSNYWKYKRGSEWRKWDLQVQPIKNSWFQNLEDKIENIESAVKKFIDNAINNKIEVIAITDHNTGIAIDYAIKYSEDKNIEVLAGVELDANSGEHLIVIFNTEYRERIEKDTWKEVVETFMQTKCNIEPPFYEVGKAKKVKVTTEELISIVNREDIGVFIFAHCTSGDGFFQKCGDKGRRRSIAELFLKDNYQFVFEVKEFKKAAEVKSKLKGWQLEEDKYPIISSSDANQANDVGRNFTWIKADPTFNGLRQIIFEPTERIKVQIPEPDVKSKYNVIDSIKLEGGIWNGDIFLNRNMNAIIGGRSTGKSNLLKCMVKEVNKERKFNLLKSNEYIDSIYQTINVKWLDNENEENREIEFFEQNNIYEIADSQEETDKLIRDIIKGKDSGDKLLAYDKYCIEKQNEIKLNLNKIFQLREEISMINETIKEKGNKKGILKEIQLHEEELRSILTMDTLTQDESRKYEEVVSNVNKLKGDLKKIDLEIQTLVKLTETFHIDEIDDFELGRLSSNTKVAIKTVFKKIKQQALEEWVKELNLIQAHLEKASEEIKDKITVLEKTNIYEKGIKYFKNNEHYNVWNNKLRKERQKLDEIVAKTKARDRLIEKIEELIKEVIEAHISYHEKAKQLEKELTVKHEDILINLKTKFRENSLREFLEDRLNLKIGGNQTYVNKIIREYDSNIEETVFEFIERAIKGDIAYKGNYTDRNKPSVPSDFASTNWFDISFELIYDGDKFEDMSPGKQAFVILNLLLEFSDKECPILIDQPEDNLDNRAIYFELVQYLKKKKKERQIILVTHNPNVVVSADAEQIIVANQHGKNSQNTDSIQFQYVSGALEYSRKKDKDNEIVLESQGIREHVCEILEGGDEAFKKRERKYGIN